MTSISSHPRWMTHCLVAAGIYNLLWGGLTVLWPGWLFTLTGMEQPLYPFIWQCVGMIVGVEQRLDFRPHLRIFTTSTIKELTPVLRLQADCLSKD